MPRHPLFQAALDADEAFTRTIAELFPGKDRWSLTRAERLHPGIAAAYTAKTYADREWIDHLRAHQASHDVRLLWTTDYGRRLLLKSRIRPLTSTPGTADSGAL